MAADPERRMSVDVSEKAGFDPADLIRPAPFDGALPPLRCRRPPAPTRPFLCTIGRLVGPLIPS